MIQNLETTLKAGAVPMAPQFHPASAVQPAPTASIPRSSSGSSPTSTTQVVVEAKSESSRSPSGKKEDDAKPLKKSTPAGPFNTNGTADPLGDARSKVQEEIGREFAAIMATGTLRASEAAALATKRVMQKYGHATLSQG